MTYITIYEFKNELNLEKIIGPNSRYLHSIEDFYKEEIIIRGSEVKLKETTNNAKILALLFEVLETILRGRNNLSEMDLTSILNSLNEDNKDEIINLYLNKEVLITTTTGKTIYPKSLNQKKYLDALEQNSIVFAVGPAGTGKTYLGVLYAIRKLKQGDIRKIVLVRPVVEAGEKLGFLPGDLKEKIDPYLVPLYDSLNEALGKETVDKLMTKGVVEVAPLAYMRGRTLENAIVILDEAQNSTKVQMKMFLTRLGFGSKMIITGDVSQIDLQNKHNSGMVEALRILKNIKQISIVEFAKHDVMRHPLVQKIIERYDDKIETDLEEDNGN